MHALAQELNDVLAKENRHLFDMLSRLGREIYFPKGILSQSAEAGAKGKKINATIGIALEKGVAMNLDCVMASLKGLTPDQALKYAPPTGLPDLRKAWLAKVLRDNPSLAGKPMSLPVVTNGLTHSLSIVADLFCEPGDALVLPDKVWDNYPLAYVTHHGAVLHTYPFYTAQGGFNVEGFAATLRQAGAKRGKVITILNFPNNPTGYSPTRMEAEAIGRAVRSVAESGIHVVCVCDDAYFGLFYEPDVCTESVFAQLAGAHPRLLAVKGDAATKELFVWGLRVGFLAFSIGGVPAESPLYAALEKKVSGIIRSVMSNCAMPSQQAALKALASPAFVAEHAAKAAILRARAQEVKRVLAQPKYADAWEMHPFNSGYFMCLKLKRVTAEALRKHLLEKYAVGTIAADTHDLRIAFSCVEKEQIAELFEIIHQAARDLA